MREGVMSSFSLLRLGVLAMWVAAAAGARLEVSRQPVGNSRKGFALAQQPQVQVVLDMVEEITPAGAGTVNSLGGDVKAPLQRNGVEVPTIVDVTISNTVTVTFGSNPVGATFAGGVKELNLKMVKGVADFSDIQIMQGGAGFTLSFAVHDAQGRMLTVDSGAFHCGGQEARLVIVQQPILTVEGATTRMTPPILHVVDRYSRRLELANPVITVSMFANPGSAGFTSASHTAVRASDGIATVDQTYLTAAATELEIEVPVHLADKLSTKNKLRFSSPGFPDVISIDFETLPVLSVEHQPISDHTRTLTSTCFGNFTGCAVHLSNYLRRISDGTREKLQTARLHVDIACTDLDGPDEFVTGVTVGSRRLTPGLHFDTGPWEECGFAGCRDQCDSNMRRVVSGLNVKDDIGTYDRVTKLYKSMGNPLRVHVSITDKVNICPCSGQPLKIKAQLVVTYSQAPEEQGSPMRQQPRVLLSNADGSPYMLRQKFVSVTYATAGKDPFDAVTAFGNPSGALLLGNTRVLSEKGMVQFTDLAISEGGKGYVLRFSIAGVYNVNSTSMVDSQHINVGCGNFPQLTLDCVDCSRPAPSRQEARSLSQPPQLELQKTLVDGTKEVKSRSYIKVTMSFGVNGPGGMFSGDSITVRNADGGAVKFPDTTIYNGNCAFCPAGNCGEGYTLFFITNDVALESQSFNIAGGNRSPRFIAPSPPAGALFVGLMGVPRKIFTLNITDDNLDSFTLNLLTPQSDAFTCQPARTCLRGLNGAREWGRKVQFMPQADDDECIRPLFSNNGPLTPTDGLYWGVYADMTFSATCQQAASTYPPPSGVALAVERTCFRPDDKVERVDPPISSYGEERCFEVKVMTPAAPFFTHPFRFNHTQAGIERIASPSEAEAAEIAARMEMLEFPAPPLATYVPPHAGADATMAAMAGEEIRALYVGVGCRIVLPLAAAEVQAKVVSNNTLETHLTVRASRTTRSSLYEQRQLLSTLPEGAQVHEGLKANPHVSSFEWEPMRGQEGYVYTVCFEIVTEFSSGCIHRFYTAPYHGHASQYCLDIHVERCKYCLRGGESFQGLARGWGTTSMQLWAGNPDVVQPSVLGIGQLLNLGVIYIADVDDRLPKIAERMGRTVDEVLQWNPDLPRDHVALRQGDQVLMSSATMYAHRQAPWAVRNGTFVADSQGLCLLPNICTYAPIPVGKVAVEVDGFSCDSCAESTEFCTGAICVTGEDGTTPPWTSTTCKTYRGSRCERCGACQQEQFDLDGHLSVKGTYRSGGCNALPSSTSAMAEEDTLVTCKDCTLDSTCEPCSECTDGQIESKACTPMSNRVCVKAETGGKVVAVFPHSGYVGFYLPAPK